MNEISPLDEAISEFSKSSKSVVNESALTISFQTPKTLEADDFHLFSFGNPHIFRKKKNYIAFDSCLLTSTNSVIFTHLKFFLKRNGNKQMKILIKNIIKEVGMSLETLHILGRIDLIF